MLEKKNNLETKGEYDKTMRLLNRDRGNIVSTNSWSPCFFRLTWYVMLMLWNRCFLEFILTILYTYVFVWKHKETSQLTTALAKCLVLMWYHTEVRSKLFDVNLLIRKTLHSNFFSLKTSFTKVDVISQRK